MAISIQSLTSNTCSNVKKITVEGIYLSTLRQLIRDAWQGVDNNSNDTQDGLLEIAQKSERYKTMNQQYIIAAAWLNLQENKTTLQALKHFFINPSISNPTQATKSLVAAVEQIIYKPPLIFLVLSKH